MIVLQQYRDELHRSEPDVPKPDSSALVAALQQVRTTEVQTRPTLARQVADVIGERHADAIQALAEEFGVHLSKHGSRGAAPTDQLTTANVRDVRGLLASYNPRAVRQLLFGSLRHALLAAESAKPVRRGRRRTSVTRGS